MNPADIYLTRLAEPEYPGRVPFHPDQHWPESIHDATALSAEANPVYRAIRELLQRMELDAGQFDTPRWNPFAEWVRPGGTVVIKPNLVMHRHGYGWDPRSVITHPSLIRAVTDFALKAVGPSGRVIIGDAPLQSCDFAALCRESGLQGLVDWYQQQGFPVILEDFRFQQSHREGNLTLVNQRTEWDQARACPVDLGNFSLLTPLDHEHEKFRVTCYDPQKMRDHHCPGRHEYLIHRRILEADLVISLAKPKTHRKGGITGALKNLVGINAHKDWLPHHRRGAAERGGDEYPHASFWKRQMWNQQEQVDVHGLAGRRFRARLHEILRKGCSLLSKLTSRDSCHEGSWWGNDTLWRMVLDLNRVLRFGTTEGTLSDKEQRKVLCFGDMVISGEQEGPLEPHPKGCGLILAALDPAAFDLAVATVMGFDWRKIPIVREAFGKMDHPVTQVRPETVHLHGTGSYRRRRAVSLQRFETDRFQASEGWKGHIELPEDWK